MSKAISELEGKIITKVDRPQDGLSLTIHATDPGTGEEWKYTLYHEQDCCEQVWLEDITGELGDLVCGQPVLEAQMRTAPSGDGDDDVEQWTFYRISTVMGTVVLRWYGSSNGYYSTDVNLLVEKK